MKQVVLATLVALTTTVQADAIDDIGLLDELRAQSNVSLEIPLTAFGVIDYYQHNCAGLTPHGKKTTLSALYSTDLHLLTASELTNTKAFRNGFRTASKFGCNDLRYALHDIGARDMFR